MIKLHLYNGFDELSTEKRDTNMKKHFLILLTCLFLICSMIGCSSRETASQEENTETGKGYLGQQVCDSVEENKVVIANSFVDINGIDLEELASRIQEKKAEEAKAAAEAARAEAEAAYDMQDWEKAYVEYLEGFTEGGNVSSFTYSLIYVNDDDVPELVIDSGFEAGGCLILTYHNGEIDELQTARLNYYYIERQNLINNSDGHMGYYYDYIYAIKNGKWISVARGEWTEDWEEIDDEEYVFKYTYTWNDKEVDKDTYTKKLNAVFDTEQQMRPEYNYYIDDILLLLKTGKVFSDTHRYEIFVEDISYEEAKVRCKEKGGYLADITTFEEYMRIQSQIENSGQENIYFWIDEEMLTYINILGNWWAPGEPSWHTEVDGKKLDEDGMFLFYDGEQKKCLVGDMVTDILSYYPEYEGKIGYICEYDR